MPPHHASRNPGTLKRASVVTTTFSSVASVTAAMIPSMPNPHQPVIVDASVEHHWRQEEIPRCAKEGTHRHGGVKKRERHEDGMV
jgi:hypothetical protein